MAFVFQQYSLYPHMSVFDNLAFPLRSPARRTPEPQVRVRVGEIARLLHIEDKLARRATELSGGPDAREVLAAMISLVERRFDEEPAAAAPERRYRGVPAAPGLAAGPIFVVGEALDGRRAASGDAAVEAAALPTAIVAALADLRRLVNPGRW